MASAWSWVSGSRYSLICTWYLPFPRLNAVTAFPDILDIADLDLKALASKGLFVDLNEYLEPSSSLDRSDFLDNLLDAYTVNGRLITS